MTTKKQTNESPPTLRLKQTVKNEHTFHIDVELDGFGPRIDADADFTFALTDQEQQDIRWYVEEYAEYPFPPHPERAARVEQRMHELGEHLFQHLFQQAGQQRLWAKVYENLSTMRIEVVSTPQEAAALPWELLRDPHTDTPVALNAGAFVRAHTQGVRQARQVQAQPPIRILLVICRPGGRDDVPFRSVASRLVKGLSDEARAVFQLDVLRPPTFERLGEVLRLAHKQEQPYHVVHFDGHGVYGDPHRLKQAVNISPNAFRGVGSQGFLLFEHDDPTQRLVHGLDLGNLLHETGVPLLVLNACRSAHTEATTEEEEEQEPQQETENPYDKVRAFGSLAQQVMLQGVTGVVAMRYNVYVVTAAQFVANLYASLTRGFTLGEAVTFGRKQLAANPQRHIVGTIELQDWMVPIVYEADPVQLFAPTTDGLNITIKAADATPKRGMLDADLPPEPDVGFFGRDEVLLALDRGFDRHHALLLHAYAGSGKTTTAAEFARWYSLTGGVDGPVLFTSFEQYKLLVQVLDQLGRLFDPLLQQHGIPWDAIPDAAQKRDIALQVLRRVPVLWVWDNVEPVAGFPANTPSAWTDAEQRELAAFLRDARQTRAKFLLTSRREEHGWLGDLPQRVAMGPMPMGERRQLAEALAARYGEVLTEDTWRPLLVYSGGNPLTLTVVVRQALRDHLSTPQQVADYVQRLRAGEVDFGDDASEGRTKSLGASLAYGFATAFSAEEHHMLALLHHFQGFVDVDALIWMGDTSEAWHVPAVAGITRERCIALLDRAAEVGLLTPHGSGFYTIHPALPWFFRRLHQEHYPDGAPTRAYVEAMGALGDYYHNQYGAGNRGVIEVLKAEEANLLHARRLARAHGWYWRITSTMQGLRSLYDHTGRRAEWRRLVEEIVPDFVDPATDGPLAGREEQWSLVMEYRVRLLREERQWDEAARLQGLQVDYQRQQAAPLLALEPAQLDSSQRHTLRSLAVSVEQLGHIQREQGAAVCVDSYQEAMDVFERIGAQTEAAVIAFNLGHAYLGDEVPALRDLAQAEQWYRRNLELRSEGDHLGRGKTLGQLGLVAYERFKEAREVGQPEAVLREHWSAALHAYQQALDMFPPDAVDELATCHNQLGNIYNDAGQTEQAVAHYRESIRYDEMQGNLYGAALTRYNVALAYADAARFEDALLFARAALRNFEEFGPRAADMATLAQELVAEYEAAVKKGGG
jgi:tetratricopeptide (TPR) repeat protein